MSIYFLCQRKLIKPTRSLSPTFFSWPTNRGAEVFGVSEWKIVQRFAGTVVFSTFHTKSISTECGNITIIKCNCVSTLILGKIILLKTLSVQLSFIYDWNEISLYLYFFHNGFQKFKFVWMFCLNVCTNNQQFVSNNVFVVDCGASQPVLKHHFDFDKFLHTSNFGLTKCTLVFGRHLGTNGQSTLSLESTTRKKVRKKTSFTSTILFLPAFYFSKSKNFFSFQEKGPVNPVQRFASFSNV